jgi:ribonuclease E
MNKGFVFEIDADEVVKQAQSPWEFSGYSATMNEEHSERNTTSIDQKINAVIKQIAKKYVEDDDIQHTEELQEDDGSEVSDGEEAAQGDDDEEEDSDDGEAEHIEEEVSEDGEESEHSDDEESGGEEAEQSDEEESDGEAEQSDGPQIPRRLSSKASGP